MVFYPGAGRHEALEAVLKAAMQSQPVAVIAPQGGGVTTLLGQAAMRLVDYGTVIRMDGAEMETLTRFLQALSTYFEVPENVLQTAIAEAVEFAPLVIVADSAHVISTDVLMYLAELKDTFAGALAVVFGGRPRFIENLPMPAWQDTVYVELAPLSAAQAVVLLEKKQPRFLSPTEVAMLVRQGSAWPGALLQQFTVVTKQGPMKRKALPWWHIAAAFVLLLLLLFVWALKNQTNERITKTITLPAQQVVPKAPVQAPSVAAISSEREKPITPAPSPSEAQQDDGMRAEVWLAKQDPNSTMMQMMLATTEQQAQTAVAKIRQYPASYYRARRNNKAVYVVLMGPFANASEGKAALAKQASEFRERGAFPRATQQVQQELQQ